MVDESQYITTRDIRPMTDEEIDFLKSKKPTFNTRVKKFLFIFLLVFILPLITIVILLYDTKFSLFGIISSSVIFVGSIVISIIFYRNMLSVENITALEEALEYGMAEVTHVIPIKVFKKKEVSNIPNAYYFRIFNGEEILTLFLQGDYIDKLDSEGNFPNSEFVITRTVAGDTILKTELLGQKMPIERVLPPFIYFEYQNGVRPDDNGIYEYGYEDKKL